MPRSGAQLPHGGRAGLVHSGGESKGAGDLAQAVATAVINKRAGGIALLHAIQDVYLSQEVTVA